MVSGGSEVQGARCTEREARPEVPGPSATPHGPPPKAKGPTGQAHIARCVGQGVTALGPRPTARPAATRSPQRATCTSVLGQPAPIQRGSQEQMVNTCVQATSPNEIGPSKIGRSNKIGACLQQGPPKRGGGGPSGGVFVEMEWLQLPPELGGACLGWSEIQGCMADG